MGPPRRLPFAQPLLAQRAVLPCRLALVAPNRTRWPSPPETRAPKLVASHPEQRRNTQRARPSAMKLSESSGYEQSSVTRKH